MSKMKAGKIVLGTVQFGLEYGINNTAGKPSFETVTAILNTALQNHINLLDTAEAYGNSQEVIGKYHQQSGNKFGVITKYSAHRNDLPLKFADRIAHNLKILHVDFLYGYMFHSFLDFETHYQNFKNDIELLKQNGCIKKFGVSIYTNQEFEKLLQYEGIDFIQLPFNLLDNASQRSDLILKAKQKGIEIHTRSVFLQGLFFKRTNELPAKLKPLQIYLDKINLVLKGDHLNMNDLSLNYAIQQNEIDYVLLGVDTVKQLEENILSLNHHLSQTTMNLIDEVKVKEIDLLNPANWNA